MQEDNAVKHFRQHDVFSEFSDEQLYLLSFASDVRILPAGMQIYAAGERADGAYILVSGTLISHDGPEFSIPGYEIMAPALVGEIGLMLTRPRGTSVSTKDECVVIFVPREPFLKLLRADPYIAEYVSDILRKELETYLQRIVDLAPQFKK